MRIVLSSTNTHIYAHIYIYVINEIYVHVHIYVCKQPSSISTPYTLKHPTPTRLNPEPKATTLPPPGPHQRRPPGQQRPRRRPCGPRRWPHRRPRGPLQWPQSSSSQPSASYFGFCMSISDHKETRKEHGDMLGVCFGSCWRHVREAHTYVRYDITPYGSGCEVFVLRACGLGS